MPTGHGSWHSTYAHWNQIDTTAYWIIYPNMNNFSELLDTKQYLEINIDGITTCGPMTWSVTVPLVITLTAYRTTTVDGFLIEDWQGETTEHGWRFDTVVPFYQWKHHATAQGWLFYQNAWR